ncbi:MAG: DUF6142 family protein [Cyanobacteria bacterium P01_A01_bin.84]
MSIVSQNCHNLKHSRLGIISFILSAIATLIIFVVRPIYYLNIEAYTKFLLLVFLGIGLGIIGLLQKDKNRLFPILGIIISSACLLVTIIIRNF